LTGFYLNESQVKLLGARYGEKNGEIHIRRQSPFLFAGASHTHLHRVERKSSYRLHVCRNSCPPAFLLSCLTAILPVFLPTFLPSCSYCLPACLLPSCLSSCLPAACLKSSRTEQNCQSLSVCLSAFLCSLFVPLYVHMSVYVCLYICPDVNMFVFLPALLPTPDIFNNIYQYCAVLFCCTVN
jgi:hypothetical protein